MVKYIGKHSEKGVTLVELVVYIGVSTILLTMVLGIFFTTSKVYKNYHSDMEIEQQGHMIMDFLTGIIMSSNSIENIENYKRNSCFDKNIEVDLGLIKLKDTDLEEGKRHIITIQKDPKVEGKSIRYGKSGVATIEAGNYIKSIYIEPLPREKTYKEAKGLKLTIDMEKDRSNMQISKSIYFRKH